MPGKRKYKDRAAYMVRAVAKRRKKLKDLIVEYKGGQCCLCGYRKYSGALELHHLDKSKKEFALSKEGLTRSLEKMKAEANKCVLVCANCHREIHAKITQPPEETRVENSGITVK